MVSSVYYNFKKGKTRREFFSNAGKAVFSLAFVSACGGQKITQKAKSKNLLGQMICSSPEAAQNIGGKGTKYKKRNNLFYFYDMDNNIHRELELPLGRAHDTLVHPTKPHHALVIERNGPYACLVDFKEMKLVKRIKASPGHFFTGHGTFTPDGSELLLPQNLAHRVDLSEVAVYEASKSFAYLRSFQTGGISPHEFSWFADGKRLAIGHYGLPAHSAKHNLHSVVVIYDYDKKETLNRIHPPEANLYLCHLKVSKNDKVFALSHDGLAKEGEEYERLGEMEIDYEAFVEKRPRFLIGEMLSSPILFLNAPHGGKSSFDYNYKGDSYRWGLSVQINERYNVVAGTHGMGQVMTFQDFRSGKFIDEYRFKDESPRGLIITKNEKFFVVTTSKGNIHFFDAKTRKLVRSENPKRRRYNYVTHAACVNVYS